jgi:tetratricopeptide (TPR) repeat protein
MLIALIGAFSLPVTAADAPTPRERTDKDFDNSNEMTPPTSRFRHRRDYRQEEADRKQDEETAKKEAAENANKARQMALLSAKQRQQAGVDANNKGVALGQEHRFAEAIAAHEEAVQADPSNKQFRINLSAARCGYGQEKLKQGDLSAAANLFRKSLAAAQDNGLAGKMLVETMKKQGKDPNNVDTRMDMGDQLASIGDLEGAAVEYEAAMQLDPSAKTYTKMGEISLRYGQSTTALNWVRQAIGKDANYGPAHRELGMLALGSRDYTTAATELRRALVIDPGDGLAGETLVSIWRRQVAQNPLLAENHLGLAGALQLTGDFSGADEEYRKLEALDPRNASLPAGRASLKAAIQHAEADKYMEAAETLFGQGLNREALAQISRAASMEPRNAKYQYLFGRVLEANGEYQAAHDTYLRCVLLEPNNTEAATRLKDMQTNMANRTRVMPMQAPMQQAPMQPAPNGAMQLQQQPMPPLAATIYPGNQPQPSAAIMSAAPAPPAQPTQQELAQRALQDALVRVTQLESQKKYDDACDLMRQIVAHNLQNAEMHHRLAVDLLAGGTVDDAISEFRLACALRPDKTDYSSDLAQAMAIHKRTLQANAGNNAAGGTR